MEAQRTERRLPATLGFTKPPCGHDILQDLHGLWPWQRGMTASCGHVMLRKAGHNMGKITNCSTPSARSNTTNPSTNDRLAPASTNNLSINGNQTGRRNWK